MGKTKQTSAFLSWSYFFNWKFFSKCSFWWLVPRLPNEFSDFFCKKRVIFIFFCCTCHCVQSVRIWSYSALHFSSCGLNTERYSVSIRIQFECGKSWTWINPNAKTFNAVCSLSNCDARVVYKIISFSQIWDVSLLPVSHKTNQ